MNYRKILLSLAAAVFACSMSFGIEFPQADKDKISDGLNSFATELMYVIPENATQQNVWADAYIGKLLPSFPPHFGGGITIGGTLINAEGITKAADSMISMVNGISDDLAQIAGASGITGDLFKDLLSFGKLPSKLFLPTATVDLRIGGLFLPFDIGFSAMFTNPSLNKVDLSDPSSVLSANGNLTFGGKNYNGSFDYLTIGGDLRYALLEGDLILPKISIGAGYYYTKGSIGFSATPDPIETDLRVLGKGKQITTGNINLAYNTQTAFVQVEVSKKIAIVTIFGGARGVVSSSTNSWSWNFKTENKANSDNNSKDLYNEAVANLKVEAEDNGTVSSGNDISSEFKKGKWDFKNIQPQVYAGVGFNFLVLQTTLGVSCDVSSLWRKNTESFVWSGFFSFRAKL